MGLSFLMAIERTLWTVVVSSNSSRNVSVVTVNWALGIQVKRCRELQPVDLGS